MAISMITLLALSLYVSTTVPPEIPLHYSLPWGTKQLVPKHSLFWIAGIASTMSLVQTTVASLLFRQQRQLARVVVWGTCLIVFFIIISVMTVFARVGS